MRVCILKADIGLALIISFAYLLHIANTYLHIFHISYLLVSKQSLFAAEIGRLTHCG